MTVAQPAAGTAIHSDWTTQLVFARNEAETTASTLAAGSATRTDVGSGPTWATDAAGRYKRGTDSNFETWNGVVAGPEITMLAVMKFASNGANQAIVDSDDSATRNWQWRLTSSGTVEFIGFNTSGSVDVNFASSATVSTTDDVAIIVRVRNDGGTYKAKVWVGSTSTSENNYSGTPVTLNSGELIALANRLGGAQPLTASNLYFSAVWNAALSDTDLNALGANPWAIYDEKGGGGSAVGAGLVQPILLQSRLRGGLVR